MLYYMSGNEKDLEELNRNYNQELKSLDEKYKDRAKDYEENIKEIQQARACYFTIYKKLIAKLKAKNRQIKNLNKLVEKISYAKGEDKIKYINSAKKILGDIDKNYQQNISSAMINEMYKTYTYENKREIFNKYNLENLLSGDVLTAVKDALSLYENQVKKEQSLTNRKNNIAAEKSKERANITSKYEQYKEKIQKGERLGTSYSPSGRRTTQSYEPKYVSDHPKSYDEAFEKERIISEIKEENKIINERENKIIEEIFNNENSKKNRHDYGLTVAQETRLKNNFDEIGIYKTGFDIDDIDQAIKIQDINKKVSSRREKVQVEDILMLAIAIAETLPNNLYYGVEKAQRKGIEYVKIFNKMNLSSSLSIYENAYEKFMKEIKNLSEEEKMSLVPNAIFSGRYKYEEICKQLGNFDPNKIISPKDLKSYVNKQVLNKIKNDNAIYANYENVVSDINKIAYTTQFMDVDEIASLYLTVRDMAFERLKGLNDDFIGYNGQVMENVTEKNKQEYKEKMACIQEKFAYVLYKKLHKDAKLEFGNANVNKELIAICQTYFNEEPKFNVRTIISKEDKKINNDEVKNQAKERFYGLSKTKQSLIKISSEWKKFEELMQKDTLTNDEVNELNTMFRR